MELPLMDVVLGHVTSVSGSQLVLAGQADTNEDSVGIGTVVKIRGRNTDVLGTITAMALDGASGSSRVINVELFGELSRDGGSLASFNRGVLHHPQLGAPVVPASETDRAAVFQRLSSANLRIGVLSYDEAQPAYAMMDELLAKHFAVVGATGSGKSSAVAVILSAILEQQPNAHIIVLDPHNEYAAAFGDLADVLNVDNFVLPFWLFDLEEAVRILVRGGTAQEQEVQTIILKDVITQARRYYARIGETDSITVDTPVPFRVYELMRFLNEAMGRLDKPDTARPYLRLRARLESLRDDKRFAFLFTDSFDEEDSLSQVIGRLLRIPVRGKPITIIDLSGVPSEIADVVVSLSCRVVFDFTLWSDPEGRPPILLICEEAHRYVPADSSTGFAAAARALTRFAKEGRKYGLSLGLVSQRPSELSTYALSQCGTIFALRLANELDQRFVAKALSEFGQAMLTTLPMLRTQEAIAFGEAVPVPMRMRFDDLPPGRRPYSDSAQFSKAWQVDSADEHFRDAGIRHWRKQSRRY
jgi:DNA helicase HerA-like ATPase